MQLATDGHAASSRDAVVSVVPYVTSRHSSRLFSMKLSAALLVLQSRILPWPEQHGGVNDSADDRERTGRDFVMMTCEECKPHLGLLSGEHVHKIKLELSSTLAPSFF